MSLLDDDDVAYMRGTQAEALPTPAVLTRKAGAVPDGMGGQTSEQGPPAAIQVRLNMATDKSSGGDVPVNLANKYQATDLVIVHVDPADPALAGQPLHVHDRLVVGPAAYTLVSDGYVTDWTTAQTAWAVLER